MFGVLVRLTLLAGQGSASPVKRGHSGKAGISWPVQELTAKPVDAFFASGSAVTWWWDWNKNYGPSNALPNTPAGWQSPGEFIPELWEPANLNDGLVWQSGFSEIKGFNEPDQNGIDVATAAAAWKTMVTQVRTINPAVKLHSPAMASNQDWLSEFFDAVCPGWTAGNWATLNCAYAPDYVSVHAYQTDLTSFKGQVSNYHTTFGLPVVVDEFAAFDWGTGAGLDAAGTSAYMAGAISWLDSQAWVIKYSWFGAMTNDAFLGGVSNGNRLMDDSGNLNALGKQYVNGGAA